MSEKKNYEFNKFRSFFADILFPFSRLLLYEYIELVIILRIKFTTKTLKENFFKKNSISLITIMYIYIL